MTPRARSVRTLLLPLLATSVLWAGTYASGPSDARAAQGGWETGPVQWDASEVLAGGRSLRVGYLSDSCGERNAHATVGETRTSVAITVVRETAVFPPGEVISCPGPHPQSLSVSLHESLAGRRVYGRSAETLNDPRAVFGTVGDQNETVRVPRVIGFAPIDAEYALIFGYLRGQVARTRDDGQGLSRVVAQEPTAGRTVTKGTVIRLLVAR